MGVQSYFDSNVSEEELTAVNRQSENYEVAELRRGMQVVAIMHARGLRTS